MRFVHAGEYAINLDLVRYCRHTGESISVHFQNEDAVVLDGADAQKVWSAAMHNEK